MTRKIELGDAKKVAIELGRDGKIVLHVLDDAKRLLIEFDVDRKGLSKAGVNGMIDALKKIRDKMKR